MEKADLFMLMEIFMMAIGKMIKLMALEFIPTWTVLDMKVSGRKTNSTEMDWKRGLIMLHTRASMLTEGNTELVASHGLTSLNTMENLKIIILKEEAFMNGQTEECTTVSGTTTKWKATECFHGPTTEDTKDSMLTIKRKVTGFSFGPMAENTTDNGSMASNTESAFTPLHPAKLKRESGKTVKE